MSISFKQTLALSVFLSLFFGKHAFSLKEKKGGVQASRCQKVGDEQFLDGQDKTESSCQPKKSRFQSFKNFCSRHPHIALTAVTAPVVARYWKEEFSNVIKEDQRRLFLEKNILPIVISYVIHRKNIGLDSLMSDEKKSSFFFKTLKGALGTDFTEDQISSLVEQVLHEVFGKKAQGEFLYGGYSHAEHFVGGEVDKGKVVQKDLVSKICGVYKDISDDLAGLAHEKKAPDEEFVLNSLLTQVLPVILESQEEDRSLLGLVQQIMIKILACAKFKKNEGLFLLDRSVSARKFIGKVLVGKLLSQAVDNFMGFEDLRSRRITKNQKIFRMLARPFISNLTKSFVAESLKKMRFSDDA